VCNCPLQIASGKAAEHLRPQVLDQFRRKYARLAILYTQEFEENCNDDTSAK